MSGRDLRPLLSELKRRKAVLPLDNLSGDPAEEPFVAGMHEELINQLSRVGALLVTSRTSVMRYRADSTRSLPEIGRELDVDAVIEGSVLRADDQARISVQLIHVATDTHLWSESFDRELRNVLALHSDVDPLRDDSRYREFLRTVGLAPYWPDVTS